MNKKIKNLEIKIAQNRGYTTELKKSIKALDGFSNEHAESILENMDDIIRIRNAIQSIGKEFINLIDDKIAHNTVRLHETHAKDVVEKTLKKLNSSKIQWKIIQPDKNAIFYKNHYDESWNKLCPLCSGILITKDDLYKCHKCNETFREYLIKEKE